MLNSTDPKVEKGLTALFVCDQGHTDFENTIKHAIEMMRDKGWRPITAKRKTRDNNPDDKDTKSLLKGCNIIRRSMSR